MSSSIPYEFVEVEKNPDAGTHVKTFFSTWHVTVTSNVRAEGLSLGGANDIADTLKDGIKNCFRDHGSEAFRIMRAGDSWGHEAIERVKISTAAEIGKDARGGRVHVHSLVEVEHHTILQVDMPKSVELIKTYVESHNIFILGAHVDIKWIPMSQKPLEHYLGKNPLTREDGNFKHLFKESTEKG